MTLKPHSNDVYDEAARQGVPLVRIMFDLTYPDGERMTIQTVERAVPPSEAISRLKDDLKNGLKAEKAARRKQENEA